MSKRRKIIWAADPHSTDSQVLKSAAWCIRALVKDSPSLVEPVYVYSSANTDALQKADRAFIHYLQTQGQDELKSVLLRIKVPGIQPLTVLSERSLTLREEAKRLIQYAKDTGAELIVVSSHGRKGLRRFFLGSFAETLSLYSDVPLITVHPNWRRTPDFKTILFPTDFSEESKEAYSKTLDFAEEKGSKIILFHKVPVPMGFPTFEPAFTAAYSYEEALRADLAENEKNAKKWAEIGSKRGIRVEVAFDRSRKGSAAEAILKRSKRLGAMIAMASHSGPVSTLLQGSTTRKVVRNSEQPVWVIHPKPKQQIEVEPLMRVTPDDINGDLIEHGRGQIA